MRLKRLYIFATAVAMLLVQGCTNDSVADLREKDYGYVQFKLYKASSYIPALQSSRASDDQLAYLAEACKVEVNITSENGQKLRQTLILSASDNDAAEYGLRSDKLKLLSGKYTLKQIKLFDLLDNEIYNKLVDDGGDFAIDAGGLTQHDVLVDAVERGKVEFTLVKDFSNFENIPSTRSDKEREYTFDEIKAVTLTLQKVNVSGEPFGQKIKLEKLPAKFSQHFDQDNLQSDAQGYRTSSIQCDTLLSLEAAKYRVMAYTTYASEKDVIPLEVNDTPADAEHDFTVVDNQTTQTNVWVELYEADEYIQDYYALYEIWRSLDGENWYYDGETYARGTNWNFNKDVDLWGDQPGVQIHSNGRVAAIDLSHFGFSGDLSSAIGQLTELVDLQLGTHNDTNTTYDPSLDKSKSLADIKKNRRKYQREYLMSIHQPVQMSEPLAFGLAYHNITIPATSLYTKFSEREIIDTKTGGQRNLVLHDMNHGTIKNGLTSLPAEVGQLSKLERLFIANGLITELPPLDGLVSCTDMELYNCSKMTSFPMELAELPALELLNISNNKQWDADQINKGMEAVVNGKSQSTLQVLYVRENNLTEICDGFKNLKKLGMLDASFNKISRVAALGSDVSIADTYLDYNHIEQLPDNFCALTNGFNSVDNFSISNNRLKKMPNFFSSESDIRISSINVSANMLDDNSFTYEDGKRYKGLNVVTLTMSLNPGLTKYPLAFAQTNSSIAYILLNACELDEIPKGAFSHERAIDLMSLDLSYNNLKELPSDLNASNLPYLYGFEISYNSFEHFPYEPLDSYYLTVYSLRGQRNARGERCLSEWPTGIYQHRGLRGLFLGSNDLGRIEDTISTLIYTLDISDNPNIVFDASDICYAWQVGAYILYYDKSQRILNCDAMLNR